MTKMDDQVGSLSPLGALDMNPPLVTVIIPAYNAEQYISEALASVCQQSYPNLEIIVVDDGSTDRTADIVKTNFPTVRYLRQANSGSCAAPRNYGLTMATGAFVTFLDADDLMSQQKIEAQVQELLSHPEASMTISNYRNFGLNETQPDHFSTCPKLLGEFRDSSTSCIVLEPETCRSIMISENFTSACSPMYRKEDLLAESGYDVSLKACEDFHLNYRIAMRGSVIVSQFIGFERRMHDSNMSGDNERMLRNFISSRLDLKIRETNFDLTAKLSQRISQARRSLQSCLIRKGAIKEASKIYLLTFPPTHFGDLKFDTKQLVKICLIRLRLIKIENTN